jgi:hypothetical protein
MPLIRLFSLHLIVCLLFFVASPGLVDAQPRVTNVEGFPVTIHFFEGDQRVADKVSSITAEAIPRLSRQLGLAEITPFRILLIADMDAFQREQNIRLPYWGVAFALMDNQIMLVDVDRATNAWNRLEKVIPHELSHLLVAQRVKSVGVPLWFIEGLAMWQAKEWSLVENWRLMEAVWGNRAPGLGQIYTTLPHDESKARDAYRVAYAGFAERFEDRMELVPSFLDQVVRSGDFSEAFESFWSENELDYYTRFAIALHKKYKSRLLLFQTGPLFTLVAVLFVVVVFVMYVRNRRKLKAMDDAEGGLSLHDS